MSTTVNKDPKKAIQAPYYKSAFDAYSRRDDSDEDIEDASKRIKMRNYTAADSLVAEKKLFTYYCALCGALCLVCEESIDKLPVRRTDSAIILQFGKFYYKQYLKQGEHKYIKREEGVEPQWRWHCSCGVRVGYQCVPFEEREISTSNSNEYTNREHSNMLHLYLLCDSLVLNNKDAKLSQPILPLKKKIGI